MVKKLADKESCRTITNLTGFFIFCIYALDVFSMMNRTDKHFLFLLVNFIKINIRKSI